MSRPGPPVLGDAAVPPDLLDAAHRAAAVLAGKGVSAGDRIAVEGAPDDVLAWLLGADLLGAATLVVEPRWTPRERAAVLADAAPDVLVGGPVPAPGADPAPVLVPDPDPTTAFYLPTTSGTSDRPKVLVRDRGSWLRSFAALGPLPGPVLLPGSLSSSLYLFGALHALHSGTTPVLRRTLRVVEARHAGTVHLVPALLDELLHLLERSPGAGPRVVVCGGAHLGEARRARFARLLPDAELIEYYGSAEHSLIAVRRGRPTDAPGGLRPLPGVDLELRDGELWVRSPLAFGGYLRSGELHPAEEWTTVGDRVELAPDPAGPGTGSSAGSGADVLVVHGRGSGTISSGGRLVSAEEVESVLRDVPGVDDVLVAPTPHERLGALVTAVLVARRPPTLRELRAAARDGLEPAKRPRRWLVVDELPRTPSGKPARAALAARLADGTLVARPVR